MPGADNRTGLRTRIVVGAIFVLALALRIWRLDDKNLWLDESFSWQLATSNVTGLLDMAAGDIHPPLYYLMLKGWIGVAGDSLIGLRSLSVVWSLIAAYLVFRLAGRDLPRVTAAAVLFGFAVSPHAIVFSQEARMYAAVTACVLGMCLAYRHWVDSAFTSRAALAGYSLGVVLSLYLHYFTALVVAAIWLHAALIVAGVPRQPAGAPPRRLPLATWLLVHAAAILVYLPWVSTAIAQVTRGQSWRQIVTVGQLPIYFRDTLAGLIGGGSGYSLAGLPAVLAVSVLGLGLILLTLVAIRKRDERDLFLLVVAVVPMLIGLALLRWSGHMDLARYLPFAVPLALVAMARGFSASRLPAPGVVALIAAGGLATLPGLRTYYRTPVKDSDARPIVAYLTEAARASGGAQDPIFIAPGYMDTVVRFISRDALVYQRIDDEATALWRALAAASSPTHSTWLVVDYRWPGFADLARDERVQEERVPSGRPDQIKLFRVRAPGAPVAGR